MYLSSIHVLEREAFCVSLKISLYYLLIELKRARNLLAEQLSSRNSFKVVTCCKKVR